MRLPEGIVVDAKETFGRLNFSALRREAMKQDEEGKSTGELKYRTYDLKCEAQGMMIQVSLPAEVGVKTFEYNTPVELVEPMIDTVSTATYGGRANAGWYIKAKDIVAVSGAGAGVNGAVKPGAPDGAAKPQTEQKKG